MLKASWRPYTLHFTFEARTSRGAMRHKRTYFVEVWDDANPEVRGVGECALFEGLSTDDKPDYEQRLDFACRSIESYDLGASDYSSITFGLECALADLAQGGKGIYFPSPWTEGIGSIPINGLIWMGDKRLMLDRIKEKMAMGFRCLKLKIGGISFDDELALLAYIRRQIAPGELELRLDANGAFSPAEALGKLEALAKYHIHSIEQPIRAGQPLEMARICAESPIPVALDEELIGVRGKAEQDALLAAIKPAYVILKPSLCGGLRQADEWIAAAQGQGIGWWATSALESNIGLSAIAQWVAAKHPSMPQGLGTGGLYSNNVPSRVYLDGDRLKFKPLPDDGLSAV